MRLSAGTRIASTLQHLAAHPSHAASAAQSLPTRNHAEPAPIPEAVASTQPAHHPSFFSTGHGSSGSRGDVRPRPRGDWGLTWAYAQALNAGREPLMQQSGATVAAVDGSNSWWLNTFRSQEMTNSSPCPSPPRSAGYEGALTVLRGDEPERIGRTSRAYFSRRRRSRQPAALVALNRSARPNQDRRATHPQDDRGAAKRIPQVLEEALAIYMK